MEPGFYFPSSSINGQIYFNLNSGHKMPAVGLGTWQSSPEVVRKSVRDCVKAGYRLIDTAFSYENEKAIGDELEVLFKEGVKREDLFIVTKLPSIFMNRDDPIPTLKKQLADLKLDYVDLYLIHSPIAYKWNGKDLWPIDPATGKGLFNYDTHYTETWKGMEDAYRAGLAKSIGISNFNIRQVEDILLRCSIRPAVNQIETHPYLNNGKLIQYCQTRGIAITAYSPFANPGNAWIPSSLPKYPKPLEDERLKAIAAKHPGKTTAHVALRWQIQRGVAVIPKSISEERIKANLDVFDFTISHEDMQTIDSMNMDIRMCPWHHCGNTTSRDYMFDELRDYTGEFFKG